MQLITQSHALLIWIETQNTEERNAPHNCQCAGPVAATPKSDFCAKKAVSKVQMSSVPGSNNLVKCSVSMWQMIISRVDVHRLGADHGILKMKSCGTDVSFR